MKKLICLALCAIIPGCIPVYANSAPSYWKGHPYSDVLAVQEDSPIIVEREHLTFDFTNAQAGGYGSPRGRVLAEYRMTNPTNDTLSVQMAFPFAANLSNFFADEITVKADGTATSYEIYIDPRRLDASADDLTGSYQYEFGSIGTISSRELKLPGFDLDSGIKRYRFAASAAEEDHLNLEISYMAQPDRTLLICDGFNGYSYSEETGNRLHSRIRESTECEILVLGEDMELSWEVVTDEGEKAGKDRYELEVFTDFTDPKAYLLTALRENIYGDAGTVISDVQLLNSCLHVVLEENRSAGCAMIDDVVSAVSSDRIFTMVYQVEFPPGTSKNVSVGYLTEGTMDRRETVSPKYTYTYLLSPAKNWADFGSLTVEIITPEEAPYIIESSLSLERNGENRYSARLEGLPDSELTFTLYEKETVTLIDKTERILSRAGYLFFFFLPVLIIVLAVIVFFTAKSVLRRARGR